MEENGGADGDVGDGSGSEFPPSSSIWYGWTRLDVRNVTFRPGEGDVSLGGTVGSG